MKKRTTRPVRIVVHEDADTLITREDGEYHVYILSAGGYVGSFPTQFAAECGRDAAVARLLTEAAQ